METAGKLVDDDELREAMKDSGIGTPATRAAIIERLITVGYVERDGRALVATEKGLNVIRLLGEHALTSPGLTGSWEQRLGKIERGEDSRKKFMSDIAGFADGDRQKLDETLKDVRIPRARLGPCPVCGHEIVENRKGYSCWARDDPGCGFVIWKSKAGKTLPVAIARELISRATPRQAVTGFRGRSGRSFRAHLALQQTDEGKWRVEFDEPWAREGAKPPEAEGEARRPPRPRRTPRRTPSQAAPPERRAAAHRGRAARAARRGRAPGWLHGHHARNRPRERGQGAGRDGRRSRPSRAWRGAAARGARRATDVEYYLRELAGGEAAMGVRVTRLRGADRGDSSRAPASASR